MIISFTELKQSCINAINEANRRGDYDTALFFKTLYNTGFRAAEILDFSKWEVLQDGRVIVPEHKRGEPKFLLKDNIDSLIYDTLGTDSVYKFEGSKTTYSRLFLKYSNISNCYVGKKRILLHTFRHVFIKRKLSEGFTALEINQALGIKRNATTMHYIYKQYQTEQFNPKEPNVNF